MNQFLILVGDVRERLRQIPDRTVRTCVTSPPYWGLRDYGTGSWVGGSDDCTHEPERAMPTSTLEGGKTTQGQARVFRETCGHCGAARVDQQIGLETTPEQFVEALVDVFREVRRVLTDDGTLWLNLGDSYASDLKGQGGPSVKQLSNTGSRFAMTQRLDHGLKSKDLVGIPWRVAFALQADGWYLRSDIIWSKPNPMPESVTDRPTKSHEYIFLLAKSGTSTYWTHRDRRYADGVYVEPPPDYRWKNQQTKIEVDVEPDGWRTSTYVVEAGESQMLWRRINLWRGNDYYYDAEAIYEPYAESTLLEIDEEYEGLPLKDYDGAGVQNPSDTKRRIIDGMRKRSGDGRARDLHRNYTKGETTPRLDGERWNENDGRGFMPRKNDSHPTDARKRGLNDWTDEHRGPGGNAQKEITRGQGYGAAKGANGRMPDRDGGFGQPMVGRNKRSVWHVATQPYRKAHFATYPEKLIEPCILAGSRPGDVVLDTFNGSGTTGKVAVGHDRDYIGCELNPKYVELAVERIGSLSPLFTRQAADLADFLGSRDVGRHSVSEETIPDEASTESLEVPVDATGDPSSGMGS